MFITAFPISAWQANCFIVATAPTGPCVVIDPGPGAAARIADVVAQSGGLEVAAVIATHGHIDHVADAAQVCDHYQVPLWVHPADRYMLLDPVAGISAQSAGMLTQLLGREPRPAEPSDVQPLPDTGTVAVAGLEFHCQVAPGHTPGSTLLRLDFPDRDDVPQLCFTGDVLFAGSIGRTDLASGDPAAMRRTLTDIVATLDPSTIVLPGHGPQTTIGHELATNPYLKS